MSINSVGNSSTPTEHRSSNTRATDSTPVKAAEDKKSGAPASSMDTVHISPQAVDLQAVEARLKELPDVDRTRITELRNQIASGEYQTDSKRLAEKILKFESDL